MQNITMSCTNLRSVCVSKCSELTDATLLALATYNPQLRTLEVAGCNQLTDTGFMALGKVTQFFISQVFFIKKKFVFRAANILREWTWKNVTKLLTQLYFIWHLDVQV